VYTVGKFVLNLTIHHKFLCYFNTRWICQK